MIDYQEVVKYFENKLNTGVNRNRRKYYKTAISAMQELQMYKDGKLCLVPEDVYTRQCEELDAYKQLGILEEIREAVERQQALEPYPMLGIYGKIYECKECGNELEMYSEYCPFCGQKQKWGDEE